MKKRKYEKPKMKATKLTPFFFACLQNVGTGCQSIVANHVRGTTCPTA